MLVKLLLGHCWFKYRNEMLCWWTSNSDVKRQRCFSSICLLPHQTTTAAPAERDGCLSVQHWGCQLVYKKTAIWHGNTQRAVSQCYGQTLHLKYTGLVHMLSDSLRPNYFLLYVWVLLDQEKPFQLQTMNVIFNQCTEIESASQE